MTRTPKYTNGQVFNNYTIKSVSKKIGSRGEIYYKCSCSCGAVRVVRESNLGVIRGCGCARNESASSMWNSKK